MARKTTFSIIGTTLALGCCLLVSCKTASDFDPRQAWTGPADLEFMNVDMGGLKSSDLRPRNEPYHIGAGDLLDIEVVEIPETRTETLVMPDGMIYYDLAGGVRAAGLTPAELEKELAKILETEYRFPVVSVRIADYQSQVYTMLGQLEKTGSFPLAQPTTLLEAISKAGGLSGLTSDFVDLDRSVVLRGKELIPVDFSALIRKGDMSQNIYLEPGDFVILPEAAGSTIYILGDVSTPTIVPHTSRTTFMSVMAAAGGPMPSAFRTGIILIRGSLLDPQVAAVDYSRIVKGRDTDFKLEPGDMIWVPRAPWQKLQDYAALFVRSASTAYVLQSINNDSDGGSNRIVVTGGSTP